MNKPRVRVSPSIAGRVFTIHRGRAWAVLTRSDVKAGYSNIPYCYQKQVDSLGILGFIN